MPTPGGARGRFILGTLLPALLAISLFVTTFFLVLIPRFEEIIHGRKREMIREITRSAWSILEHWHREEARGAVTGEEAREAAIRQIERMRYGEEGKDYFWITDYTPVMVMHPYRPDLNGRSLTTFEDSRGKRLFVEMARIVETAGEGYVDYTWQWKDDSTRIVPKLSFVMGFAPWHWIVGTGIYLEDVRLEIAGLERDIVRVSTGITIAIAFLLVLIALQNLRSERLRQQAERELQESREKYRALVETTTEGLLMVMEDGEVFCNRTLYGILGYPEPPAVAPDFRSVFVSPPHAATFDFERFLPVAGRTAVSESLEATLRTRSGELRTVLVNLSPIAVHHRGGVVLSVKDVTPRPHDEGLTGQGRAALIALAGRLDLGFIRTTPPPDAALLEASPAAARLLGFPAGAVPPAFPLADVFADPADARRFLAALDTEDLLRHWIVPLRRTDGTRAVAALSVAVLRDPGGRPVSCDGFLEDITGSQRAEGDRRELLSDMAASLTLLQQPVAPFIRQSPPASGAPETGDRAAAAVPPPVVPETATVREALQAILDSGAMSLTVRRSEGAAGLLDARELVHALHAGQLLFLERIRTLTDIGEIRAYRDRLLVPVRVLIERGAAVAEITRLTTTISETITRRIIQLALAEAGPPPLPFAFLVLGSEGRQEQTLLTDQDNALLYADPPAGQEEAADAYFRALGERICAGLDVAGYRYCAGGIMAGNPHWCRPLTVWKEYFREWVLEASPRNLLDSRIFFDLRPAHGSTELAAALRDHLTALLHRNERFFVYLAGSVLAWEVPDGARNMKSPFDVKKVALPITDAARLYALRHRVEATNTLERLDGLRSLDVLSPSLHRGAADAHEFLLRLRLSRHSWLLERGLSLSNELDPATLSETEQLLLKRAVSGIEILRHTMRRDFTGGITR